MYEEEQFFRTNLKNLDISEADKLFSQSDRTSLLVCLVNRYMSPSYDPSGISQNLFTVKRVLARDPRLTF